MTTDADRNLTTIIDAHPTAIQELIAEAARIDRNPHLSNRSKRFHLTRVATEFSAFITPLTACKNRCSHCCNMATAISQEEANIIGEHLDIVPMPVTFNLFDFYNSNGHQDTYMGVPCTFLSPEGACTIYDVRPMACRLHHSLEDSPDLCKMGVTQEVGVINIYDIHHAYINATAVVANGGAIGDIRQFFPLPEGRTINPASVVPISKESTQCSSESVISWP